MPQEEWFGPVVCFDGKLIVGDPAEEHVTLTPESIVGRPSDAHYRWEEVYEIGLVGKTSPRLWSALAASPVWLLAAAGLELGFPAARMRITVQSSQGKVELPITMRGRLRLTRKEVETIDTLLRWLTADSSHTEVLKSPERVIQRLHRSS
ncbi:hypothetical protein [Nesterenkonia sp. Act20]|uniref:hypothetical protein n=1 Tax=Nesterenkonia sp. Act20 TaxID=1483432 RepID=UPI001C4465FA|nr:hypothetical protein [Nesterenkonia sp. Act20]